MSKVLEFEYLRRKKRNASVKVHRGSVACSVFAAFRPFFSHDRAEKESAPAAGEGIVKFESATQ